VFRLYDGVRFQNAGRQRLSEEEGRPRGPLDRMREHEPRTGARVVATHFAVVIAAGLKSIPMTIRSSTIDASWKTTLTSSSRRREAKAVGASRKLRRVFA
jgi:hypothetical protein